MSSFSRIVCSGFPVEPLKGLGMKLLYEFETYEMSLQSSCCYSRCSTPHERIKDCMPFFCGEFDQEFYQPKRLLCFVNSLFVFLKTKLQEVGWIRAVQLAFLKVHCPHAML